MLSTIIALDDESFSFALRIDAKEESVLHTISATFTNMGNWFNRAILAGLSPARLEHAA